jgi:hypothetical protein
MKMPPLGLGAGPLGDERLDDEGAEAVVRAALDHGLTLLARGYSGEGDALAWAVCSGRFDVVECSVSVADRAARAYSAGPLDEATLARLHAAWDHSWPGMT